MGAGVDKEQLRTRFKEARSAMPADERRKVDEAIAQNVMALPAFEEADAVFAHLSFGAEVETRPLIEAAREAGKAVLLPRCAEEACALRWYEVDALTGFERSPFGMEEPPADPGREALPSAFRASLTLVPALAFDCEGFRLGYGGGFYDAFLPSFPGISVGLCRSTQLVERLPVRDAHDIPVGLVVTERAVICPGPSGSRG